MSRPTLAITVLVICSAIPALAAGPTTVPDTIEARRKLLIDAAVQNFQPRAAHDAFYIAEALFEAGKIAEGLVAVNRGLDQLTPGNKENRWMYGGNSGFIAWPGLDCYLRYEGRLDEATKERYRKIYCGAVFYQRLSTSNHCLMAATTRYLATQIWGADGFRPDPFFAISSARAPGKAAGHDAARGTYFEKSDPTGEKYLRGIIEKTVAGGPGEYASRPYGAQNILPILTVSECATDPEMRRRAGVAYEACLVQLAPAWLSGHLAVFAPRSYPDTLSQQPAGVATLLWFYFGGVAPDPVHADFALRAATDRWMPPAELISAATDRSQPYTFRAWMSKWALTTYVNRHYAMFARSPKAGNRPFQGQSYPCGVMWEDSDTSRGSHLWLTHPSADDDATIKIHTHGVTDCEQEVLYKDAMLFIFQIPPQKPFPYALGYVPGGYRAVINDAATSGRIYLNYGSVLIAVSSSQPFDWNPGNGIKTPASTPRQGDSEFRIPCSAAAVAFETASPEDFGGDSPPERLQAFKSVLESHSHVELSSKNSAAGLYKDRNGNTIECAFDGIDRINGTAINYSIWPVLESPWTKQPTPTSPLTLTDGKDTRVYNFANWSIADHSH